MEFLIIPGIMLLIILTILFVLLGVANRKNRYRENTQSQSYDDLAKQLKVVKKTKKNREIKKTVTLEKIPTAEISPHKTAPKVKFVPVYDSKFSWNKHY